MFLKILVATMGIQVSFYEMDFCAKNYERAAKFFENFDVDCTIYHDDYKGDKVQMFHKNETIYTKRV